MKIKQSLALMLLACILLSGCSPAQTATSVPETVVETPPPRPGIPLAEFYESSWRVLTMRSPETVLTYGLTDIYGMTEVTLDDISDEYQHDTYQLLSDLLDTLHSYDRTTLSTQDQITYDVYEWYLQDQLAGEQFMYHDYPATYFSTTSVHEDLILFFRDLHPVADLQDARDYITRLGQVGTKIDQLLEGLRLREEADILPPEFAIQWEVYGSLGEIIYSPATQTPFYTAYQEKVSALPDVTETEKQALLNDAQQVIEDVVIPAYQRLFDYMSSMPVYRGADSGVWRLPEGEAYYDYLLHFYTTTDMTADEIHQLGLQELERIHAEMRAIFDELGYPQDEGLVALYDRVAADGGLVAGDDVLATYERLISDAEQNITVAIDIRPQAEVIVVPDPYGGFYILGSIDGSRPGMFYAAAGGMGGPYYAMPTLAYHEAVPGHHFQMSINQELQNVPAFRTANLFLAEIEGWALYAERLAWELGWYDDDPYGKLGYLQAQAFRAARLVVDTGLHAKGWAFDEAQQFFTENTGFAVGDSVNPQHQIARYIVWPGQATSYYVGYIKLLELRQHAMDELGDQFDLKEFHRVVLMNGGMPFDILERVINDYISEKKSGGG